jgi:hypothetical protein
VVGLTGSFLDPQAPCVQEWSCATASPGTYDGRKRLKRAYTNGATGDNDSCDPAGTGSGDHPHDPRYTYSSDGRMLTRDENGTTDTFTYPAAGRPGPTFARCHEAAQIGPDLERLVQTATARGRGSDNGSSQGQPKETGLAAPARFIMSYRTRWRRRTDRQVTHPSSFSNSPMSTATGS